MTSSSGINHYPSRLYEEGKSPLQNRSMNHNCYRSKFGIIKERLGDDIWSKLRDSSVGLFIKFCEVKYTWDAQRVHYFLTHQLAIRNSHEIWSLFGGRPIRFSLNEFKDITGLNCDPFPQNDEWDVDHSEFWKDLKLKISDGPKYTELKDLMATCTLWSEEKKLMLGRLVIISVGVHAISHGSRIPLSSTKRVLDSVAFENYPWGRVAFDSLISSIKIVEYGNDSYTIHGCVHVLLAWIYESVPGIGKAYGKRRNSTEVPLLCWESSRSHVNFKKFIEAEKEAHGEVCVRHMVKVSEENMYLVWSDVDDKNAEPELDNLIRDIINGSLPTNVWDVVKSGGSRQKRRKYNTTKKEDGNRVCKKQKKKKEQLDDAEEVGEDAEDPQEEQASMAGIIKMMETMTNSIVNMGVNLNTRIDLLDVKLKSNDLVEKEMNELKLRAAAFELRLESIEKSLKGTKEQVPLMDPTEATNSNTKVDDEADSNTPTWLVVQNQTPQDEFPVSRLVKNVILKRKEKMVDKSAEPPVLEKKDYKKKKIKQEKTSDDPEQTWSDPAANDADDAIGKVLTALEDKIKDLDAGTSKPRRIPRLAMSQKLPYVGNSTVKRIIKGVLPGVVHSPALYDPFEVVEKGKLKTLMDALKLAEDEPHLNPEVDERFYWKLITPRDDWPDKEYGWLDDRHMGAAMTMFRKRFLRNPSPYHNQRIAFLDQDFVRSMVNDYDKFEACKKKFVFRSFYYDHLKGLVPEGSATNMQWYTEVDHLYACHFVNENHWIALDINVHTSKIYVYDNIPEMPYKDLKVCCRPFSKMIPALLSLEIPNEVRKKTNAQFEVRRVTSDVPENRNPGDCGVYTLKYIECLALGFSFVGLCYENIQAIRLKLAAEMFDEVKEETQPLCGPSPTR